METPYSLKFGERLEKMLPQSKQQIAEELNCSDVTIRFWMKGKIPFAVHLLKEMNEQYRIDLNVLITGKKGDE